MKHLKLILLLTLFSAAAFGQSTTPPAGTVQASPAQWFINSSGAVQRFFGRFGGAGIAAAYYEFVTAPALEDSLALKSDKQNFINVKDLGAVGDGVFNNTTIINNALSTYKEVYFPDGNYLVDSLVNLFGSKITGSGVILKAITGGNQQLNTGNDLYNNVFGQEYLASFQKKVMANTSGLKILWSGDSTTDGDGLAAGYKIDQLFQTIMNDYGGFNGASSLNRGHSGINTETWRTTYLPDELAENPDMMIIRYGVNDASRGIVAFEISLRTALATIRASRAQSSLTIILMSPNTTSDTPAGRDEKWYEQVIKVYRQAARDYQCAFIDTYSLWKDGRNGAATLFMDDPYLDGRAIHPMEVMNTWIVSNVFDLTFPSVFLSKTAIKPSSLYVPKINGTATKLILDGGTTMSTLGNSAANAATVIKLSDPSKQIAIGYISDGNGAIQGVDTLGAATPLTLQPFGGAVVIGKVGVPALSLKVNSDMEATGYVTSQTLRIKSSVSDLWDTNTSGNVMSLNHYNGTSFNLAATLTRDGNATFYGSGEFLGNAKASKFKLSALNTSPSSATDTGEAYEIRFTADGIYLCIATNTWVKVALATW